MGLNPEQQAAVDCRDPKILCLASAGCGKTKTMLARIERLVNEGEDPKRILAITFTNAAAFEMKERYKFIPNIDVSKGVPEFRTFHSFCYSLIIKDPAIRKRIGYDQIPAVCDDSEFKAIKQKVKLQLNCKLTEDQLDGQNLYTRSEKDQYELFKKALIKELRAQNVLTFDIMCYNVCELFEKNEPEVIKYKDKYSHVFCDEVQDTDKKQAVFIDSFPDSVNRFLVGDCLQNIYGFRHCTNDYIKGIITNPAWTVKKLYTNYRSTRQIVNYANRFSKSYSDSRFRIDMEAIHEGDPVIEIYGANAGYRSYVDENHLDKLVDYIRASKVDSAVLCRSNNEVARVKEKMDEAGIQYSSKSKSTDSLNYLDAALSNDYMLEWLSTKLNAKDYSNYIRSSTIEPNPDIKWFMGIYGNRDEVQKAADKVMQIRNIAVSTATPKEKFEQMAKLFRMKSKCQFTGDDTTTNRQIVEMLREQVQEIVECPLYIGTIHSVKGLEYDTVYVMGVNDRSFKLGDEEMNNLFYVAVTRAKNHLYIFRR